MEIQSNLEKVLAIFFNQLSAQENSIELMVLGCSTSRVQGEKIGSYSGQEIGTQIVSTMHTILKDRDIQLGVQCCEHLNRCIVMERAVATQRGYLIVNARPVLKAGGAAATAAYELFDDPVLVEQVVADAGMDIGLTGIGMHVRHVQIPKHFDHLKVGQATVFALASRPKLIGGARAQY